MNLIICKTFEEMSEKAADIIARQLIEKSDSHIGVTTGATPVLAYKNLCEKYQDGLISFAKAHLYNLEELTGLSKEHPESCWQYLHHHLTDHVDLPEENLHMPDGTETDYEKECGKYDELLDSVPEGRLDLFFMGLGGNGHIGCNEPEEELVLNTHIAYLADSTRQAAVREFGDISLVPEAATAMGLKPLFYAKHVLMVVNGRGKAEALKKMFSGKITTMCPASLLQLHPNVTVVVDEEAACLLKEGK